MLTGNEAPIYNPRNQKWSDHFSWSNDGTEIIGISVIGRITVNELHLNRKQLQNLRLLLVNAGVHPPE